MSLRRKHLKGGDEMIRVLKIIACCLWAMVDIKGFCQSRYTEAERQAIGVKFDA